MGKMNDRSRFRLENDDCVISHRDKLAPPRHKLKSVLQRGTIDHLLW